MEINYKDVKDNLYYIGGIFTLWSMSPVSLWTHYEHSSKSDWNICPPVKGTRRYKNLQMQNLPLAKIDKWIITIMEEKYKGERKKTESSFQTSELEWDNR